MRALVLFAVVAVAPQAQPVAPTVPCTYERCAIRIETFYFSGDRMVRGFPGSGEEVGSLGWFYGGLIDTVEGAPEAMEHAQAARRSQFRAAGYAVVSGALFLAAAGLAPTSREANGFDLSSAALLGSLGFAVGATAESFHARRARSRAIWEYNRAVIGPGDVPRQE